MQLEDLKTRKDIGFVLNHLGLTNIGAEVGVAFGENAEDILTHAHLNMLLLIDPWAPVPYQDVSGYANAIKDWHGCYCYACGKLSRFKNRTVFVKQTSDEAAKTIPDYTLDFVYIDANHKSPYIDLDLSIWYPKVRSGGIFGGHDYYNKKTDDFVCNVKSAVDLFMELINQQPHITTIDQDPSWYIIKD